MKVSAIMTAAPRTIASSATLDEALYEMDAHDVRHLPVVGDGGLAGVLSDRDLLEHTGWLPRRVHAARGPGGEDRVPATVAEIMHTPPVTVSPEDTVVTAAVEFLGRRIGCLPVVEDRNLVGILTEMDMIRAYARHSGEGGGQGADPPVSRLMTGHATTVDAGRTLAEARKTMQVNDVRHLPVTSRGELIGMLSDRDARRAMGVGRRDDAPVDEAMSRDALTIGLEDPASRAAKLMSEHKIGALPVLSENGMVGILTLTDLLDHCLEALRDVESPSTSLTGEGGAL